MRRMRIARWKELRKSRDKDDENKTRAYGRTQRIEIKELKRGGKKTNNKKRENRHYKNDENQSLPYQIPSLPLLHCSSFP